MKEDKEDCCCIDGLILLRTLFLLDGKTGRDRGEEDGKDYEGFLRDLGQDGDQGTMEAMLKWESSLSGRGFGGLVLEISMVILRNHILFLFSLEALVFDVDGICNLDVLSYGGL